MSCRGDSGARPLCYWLVRSEPSTQDLGRAMWAVGDHALGAYPRYMGVQVLPATGRWEDFASFMVPRKPGAGRCVCMAYRNSSLDMPGANLAQGCWRTSMARRPAGARLRRSPPTAPWSTPRRIPHVRDEGAWSVATRSTPGSGRVNQTSGYLGTVSLFEAHGLSRVCQTAGRSGGKPRWLMRRELP